MFVVVIVLVKHSGLPLCVVDGRYRNQFYYHQYFVAVSVCVVVNVLGKALWVPTSCGSWAV